MGRRCLDRETLLFVAAGQCPGEKLSAVRRHLGKCAGCRADVVRAASGGRLGDTAEEEPPGTARRRVLKTLPVAASLLGIVFAAFAAFPLDLPQAAPVTQQTPIIVTVAVPAPTRNATRAPTPGSPAAVRVPEPRPTQVKCPPSAARTASRASMMPLSPKALQEAVVKSGPDERVAQALVDGRYIRTAL